MELKERIAQEIGEWRWKDSFYGEFVTENDRNSCRVEAGLIFDLIKEAGWIDPLDCKQCSDDHGLSLKILQHVAIRREDARKLVVST